MPTCSILRFLHFAKGNDMAARGTTIYYNGVTIYNVSTESVDQEAHFDKTNSDQIGVKVTMSVTGILHQWPVPAAEPKFILGCYAGERRGPDGIWNLRPILEALNTPLRRFVYMLNDIVVWDVAPSSSDSFGDRFGAGVSTYASRMAFENTPRVSCTIIKMISDSSCWVRFNVEFVYTPCSDPSLPTFNNVASLRWWCADDIDANTWLTTRAWNGILQVKSREKNAHMFRYITFPPIPLGWQRKSIRFEESDDNLSLRFTIIDQETIANPPFPASRWRGEVSVNAPHAGAGMKDIDMSLELEAPKGVRKDYLMFLMTQIVDSKIQWSNLSSMGASYCQGLRFREQIPDNVVSVDISIQLAIKPASTQSTDPANPFAMNRLISWLFGNDMRDKRFYRSPQDVPAIWRFVPDYNPDYPTHWLPSPGTLAALTIPFIQNPCRANGTGPAPYAPETAQDYGGRTSDQDYVFEQEGNTTTTIGTGSQTGDPTISRVPPSIGVNPNGASPYLIYRLSSNYSTDNGITAFPLYGSGSLQGGQELVVSRLRQPMTRREFKYEAVRINRWPETPTNEPFTDQETGITFVPEYSTVLANNSEESADGRKYRYTVSGVSRYILSRTPSPTEKLYIGSVPYITGLSDSDVLDSVVYLENDRRTGDQYRPEGSPLASGSSSQTSSGGSSSLPPTPAPPSPSPGLPSPS